MQCMCLVVDFVSFILPWSRSFPSRCFSVMVSKVPFDCLFLHNDIRPFVFSFIYLNGIFVKLVHDKFLFYLNLDQIMAYSYHQISIIIILLCMSGITLRS